MAQKNKNQYSIHSRISTFSSGTLSKRSGFSTERFACDSIPFPVISTGNKTSGRSREVSRSELVSPVLETFRRPLRSFQLNICFNSDSTWRSGEKETLAGSWRRERMLQMSTTGIGETPPVSLSHTHSLKPS